MYEGQNKAESLKTILYIGGFELPDKNAAAHRVISNAKLFKTMGYDTIFIGIDRSRKTKNGILNTRRLVEGFEAYSVEYPKSIGQWLDYILQIDEYLEAAACIPNLHAIVCYNFPAIALEKIRRYCRKTGIKCIADVTEWYTGLGRSIPVKVIKGMDTFLRMRIIHKRLDGLIVISRYLQNYYRCCRNVVYIPPLTDISESKWQRIPSKSTDTLYLAYAGSPGKKDRIDFLIAALKAVKRKYHLDIVGIDKNAYMSTYRKDTAFLKENKDIMFHGRIPHMEALEIVKGANYSCFFRIPDRVTTAGFPTKFSEAISCGTPVITNRSSNVADYLMDGNGYLVDKLSVESITAAIEAASPDITTNRKLFDYREYKTEIEPFFNGVFGDGCDVAQ